MTIAVAHHDSPEGRAALLHAAREAAFQHTDLAVLHVRPAADDSPDLDPLRRDVARLLTEADHADLEWSLHMASDLDGRASALVELTGQLGAQLLVLGSRRRTPIGKFLLGTTIQRVVLDSPVPVLVVKAPAEG